MRRLRHPFSLWALGAVALPLWFLVNPARTAQARATQDAGRSIWLADCATCHTESGAGSNRGPSLEGVGAAGVDFQVRTGRMPLRYPGESPSRESPVYNPAEIQALVDYTATFIDGPPVPKVDLGGADLADGGRQYRLNCASCHQMTGEGGVLGHGIEVPPLSGIDPVQVVEALRTGPGDMPRFAEPVVSASDARSIAAYVAYLDDPDDRGGWALGHWGPVPEGAVAMVFGLAPMVVAAAWLGQRSRTGARRGSRP